jgi:7-cyano-7-deazaguanine tRNA-ribosyltransferase
MEFEIKKFDANGRWGFIHLNGKKMITPNLFPVVSPFDNLIAPQEIIDTFGGSAVFTNAFILYNDKVKAQAAESVGIHKYINFNGLIATDSGAFQNYMYGINKDLTPEEIESFQERIKSDFPVILDLPVQMDDTREVAEQKIHDTLSRAKKNVISRTSASAAWFGPIHGGKYLDLVKKSALEMSQMNFGIYAIGGVVKTFNDYMFDISVNVLLTAKRFLRPDIPVHVFGLGLPQFFSLAVACGADTMDSAAYILFAKEGRYFTLEGTKNISEITEFPCSCPICSKYSVKEIQDLYRQDTKNEVRKTTQKPLQKGIELIARHNLYLSFMELKSIREAIRDGTLWELVEQRIHAHPRLLKAYMQLPKYWPQLNKMESTEQSKALFILGSVSKSRPVFYTIAQKIYNNYHLRQKSNIILIPELDNSIFNSPSTKIWIQQIEKLNAEINETKNEVKFEPIIISNLFGPIPYVLNEIYPLIQREWCYTYQKSEWELASLMKYLGLEHQFGSSIGDRDRFRINENYLEFMLNGDLPQNQTSKSLNSDNFNPEFGSVCYNINKPIYHEDIINRIELVIKFLMKNSENINSITVLRPKSYVSEDGNLVTLEHHLIDDISLILNNNQNIMAKNKKFEMILSIDELKIR